MHIANDNCDTTALLDAMRHSLERFGAGASRQFAEAAIARSGAAPGDRIADLSGGAEGLESVAGHAGLSVRTLEPACLPWRKLDAPDEAGDGFDAALSLFAASDPIALAAELARLVRPGGRIVVGFWPHPGGSRSQALLAEAVRRSFAVTGKEPEARVWTRNGDGLGRCIAMNGMVDVEVTRDTVMSLWPPLEHLVSELAVPDFAPLDEGARERLMLPLQTLLRPFADEDRGILRLEEEAVFVTATKPAGGARCLDERRVCARAVASA